MSLGSYLLVLHAPGQAPAYREITSARIVIGREVGDIVLPDPQCSSTHAELSFDGSSVRVRDAGSTNGTWMAGQRVSELLWAPGTSLQIGSYYLTLQEVRPAMPGRGRTVAADAGAFRPPEPPVPMQPPQAPQPVYANAGAPHAPQPAWNAQHSAPQVHAANGMAPHAGYAHAGTPAQVTPSPKKKSSKALWLVVPLVLVGTCGVGAGGLGWMALRAKETDAEKASGAPKLAAAREATVKFVWFRGPVGPNASGGTSPARVRVAPNQTGSVSVGVAEEFAGGGGNQWRTATWLAAFNATRTVGASLADYEFNVHVGGHTDGPSAGMLTTTTMLALLRDKPLRADSTMTGTINPDGTAGPVGGIVQKMHGAKESGLKRFGFPIGCRNHMDLKTRSNVDLVAVGRELGLETREIGDLYDAYEFMTGDKLPRTEPIAESQLEPSADTQTLLRAKVAAWKARVDRELATLKEEAARNAGAVELSAPLLQQAQRAYENAQRYESNSFLVPALDGYAETAVTVATVTRLTKLVPHLKRKNLKALLEAVDAAQGVKTEVDAFGQELEVKAQSKTRGGQVSTAAAFTHYVTARAATQIGDDFHESAVSIIKGVTSGDVPANAETLGVVLERATLPILYYDIARVYLDYSKDIQVLIADEGAAPPLPAASVDRMVAGYASASSAVLAYFNAIIVDEIGKEQNLAPDRARVVMAQREPMYYLATKANDMAEYTGKAGASDGVKLMRLSAASSAFLDGATLVNKWYSLGMNFDKAGNLVLDNRRALSAELDLARRNARESAARAQQAAGFVPAPARLAYQTASARREGNDEDKLAALAAYWQSSFWSELAAAK